MNVKTGTKTMRLVREQHHTRSLQVNLQHLCCRRMRSPAPFQTTPRFSLATRRTSSRGARKLVRRRLSFASLLSGLIKENFVLTRRRVYRNRPVYRGAHSGVGLEILPPVLGSLAHVLSAIRTPACPLSEQ